MSLARKLHHSYDDYLSALAMSELKLEYLNGEIFAMAGGTPEHGMIAANVIQILGSRLPPDCRVMTSDVKIHIEATGLSTFPDVSVVCGEIKRAAKDQNAVVNPRILVEVLSPSTEEYDRGEKLRHYQHITSLELLIFVAHDARRMTSVRRDGAGWLSTDHTTELLLLESQTIQVDDVYR